MIRLLLLLGGVGLGPAPRPRLVVVITVDQLRPDYLERYRPQLQGGFAMLLKPGASFTDAYQDHAVTEPAPGHSTILSGRWPVHTGIIRNLAGVQDQAAPLIGINGPGASPRGFAGPRSSTGSRPRTRARALSRFRGRTAARFCRSAGPRSASTGISGASSLRVGTTPIPSQRGCGYSTGSVFPSALRERSGRYSSRSGTTPSPTASPTRIRGGTSCFPTVSQPTAGKRRSPSSVHRPWTRSRSPSPSRASGPCSSAAAARPTCSR